jgi:hypothetical protein
MTFGLNLTSTNYELIDKEEWLELTKNSPHLESAKILLVDILLHKKSSFNLFFKSSKKIEKTILQMMSHIGELNELELTNLIFTLDSRAKSRIHLLLRYGAKMRLLSPEDIHISHYDTILASFGTSYQDIATSSQYRFLTLRFIQMLMRYLAIFLLKPLSQFLASEDKKEMHKKPFLKKIHQHLLAKIGSYDRYGRLFGVMRHFRLITSKLPAFAYLDDNGLYYGISGNHRILATVIGKYKKLPVLVINEKENSQTETIYPTSLYQESLCKKLSKKLMLLQDIFTFGKNNLD